MNNPVEPVGNAGSVPEPAAETAHQAAAFYVVCLNLRGESTCVVGGGKVAVRKAAALLAAGAKVHVIAERLCEDLQRLLADQVLAGRLTWQAGTYRRILPAGTRLVIACTDDREVNRQVRDDARVRHVLVNIVDDPELSDFIVPAVRQAGPIQVAVTSGGASPTLARRLAEQFVGQVRPDVAQLAELLAEVRPEVRGQVTDPGRRKVFFRELSGQQSQDILAQRGVAAWRQWYQQRLAHYRQ